MNYKEEHIRQFYEVVKQLPQNVDKDQVFQLIDNPPPGGRGTSYGSSFSPFKLTMMSITTIIISALLFVWMKPESEAELIPKNEIETKKTTEIDKATASVDLVKSEEPDSEEKVQKAEINTQSFQSKDQGESTSKPILKHSYTFDNGNAHDEVGNAHGVVHGGSFIEGKYIIGNNNGYKEYIELPAEKIRINQFQSITLEAFIRTDHLMPYYSMLAYFGDSDTVGYNYLFLSASSTYLTKTGISCTGKFEPWTTETNILGPKIMDGNYHHLVMTFDNTSLRLFVDGELIQSLEVMNPENSISNISTEYAFIGKSGYLIDATWWGAFDEFNIYEGVLEEKTIYKTAKKYLDRNQITRFVSQIPARSCDWPDDTVIYASDLAVKLNIDELEPLGFLAYDSSGVGPDEVNAGYFYYNKYDGFTSALYESFNGNSGKGSILSSFRAGENIKFNFSANNFYIAYADGSLGSSRDYFVPELAIDGYGGNFESVRHQLVPVIIDRTFGGDENGNRRVSYPYGEILYFVASSEFFKALPERYHWLEDTYQCIQDIYKRTNRKVIYYLEDVASKKGNMLHLDRNALKKIGFVFSDSAILFSNSEYEIYNTKKVVMSNFQRDDTTRVPEINLLFATNVHGTKIAGYIPNLVNDMRKFDNSFDLLVPIKLEKDLFPEYLNEDRIYWFEPTDSLFANLPPEIGEELKRDYEYLTTDDKTDLEAKCTFFTICKTELKINSFNLFPNPATEKVNINFSLSEDLKASVGVYDLQGKLLNQPITDQQYFKGMNAVEVRLDGLAAGVYLLKLSTSNGYKIQRFVVE